MGNIIWLVFMNVVVSISYYLKVCQVLESG